MPDLPPAAIRLAADAVTRELQSDHEYAMSADSDEALARAALDAAAPALAEHVARKILAHMEAHGPVKLGVYAWRRHFGIAARVAAGAFMTRDDTLRAAAEAIARGDFAACPPPEDQR